VKQDALQRHFNINSMNKFGTRSLKVQGTLHADLVKITNLMITRTKVDVGLHQGARTIEEQREYHRNGKSNVNPDAYSSLEELAEKGKHITIAGHPKYGKSRAVDLHIAEKYQGKGLTWDMIHLSYVAGVMISCAQELYDKGEITHLLRWGCDWDSDGIIALDQKLDDGPHFELIEP